MTLTRLRPPLFLIAVACVTALPVASACARRPAWLTSAKILVPGDVLNQDCRTGVCKHNENTDLTRWRGAIWFVHRTAGSQVLGPNSSLRVYRSTDRGRSFKLQSIIPAPPDRDIRDPSFYTVGRRLHIKAITRLPGFALRDQDAGSISVETHSTDGRNWSPRTPIGPEGWGFWRVVERAGVYYSAAYEDGDLRVVLYRSHDGTTWTKGAQIYGVSKDTPLETELAFSPSRKYMLGLVRMDGNNYELLGNRGRLRTKVCWARAPSFANFTCPQELKGVRLDGAVAFYYGTRLPVRRDVVLEPARGRPRLGHRLRRPDRHLEGHAEPREAATGSEAAVSDPAVPLQRVLRPSLTPRWEVDRRPRASDWRSASRR